MKIFFTLIIFLLYQLLLSAQFNNYFAGNSAGASNTTGSSNSFVGFFAGLSNTIGNSNSFFGNGAGSSNITGKANSYFGSGAGSSNTGSYNSIIGNGAGRFIVGSNNIIIGYGSGPTQMNSTQNNKLFIDVGPIGAIGNDNPLIYGEFDNDFVKINGTFEVTAGLSNPSDMNIKNNFEAVNANEILDKLSKLEISKWTYKERQDEPHIGATAQGFYKAFGLGSDDKHISTIDADGISLLAIQALKQRNDKLQYELDQINEKNDMLEDEINELKSIVLNLIKKLEN